MPTPNEKRALIFLAALGAIGVGVRAFRGAPPTTAPRAVEDASRAALNRQIGAVDSATAAKRASGRGRGRRGGAKADTLPGDRVVADRRTPSRAAGPQTADSLPDPLALYEARRLEVARRNRETQSRIERDRGAAQASTPAQALLRETPGHGRGSRELVDLDTAGVDLVASLPWVGPGLAARIVADRAARGPFGSLAGLERVRGVGPGLAAKIGRFVTFSRRGTGAESVVKFRAVRVRPNRP